MRRVRVRIAPRAPCPHLWVHHVTWSQGQDPFSVGLSARAISGRCETESHDAAAMSRGSVGCPRFQCTNVLTKRILRVADASKRLRCDNCFELIKGENPYSCETHDIDYCKMCYDIRVGLIWGDDDAARRTRKRTVEVAIPARRRASFADAEAADEQEGEVPAADGEAPAAPASGGDTPYTVKRSGKDRQSPVSGRRRTVVPFDDPSQQPFNSDGVRKDDKTKKTEHKQWCAAIVTHVKLVEGTLNLREGCQPRVINRIMLGWNNRQRDQFRQLGFMKQERHFAKMEAIDAQKRLLYTPSATVDVQYDQQKPMTTRQVKRIRDRLA
jgi:hypothetical protein